jgi:heme-degrading monooxygenase HmoA
MTIVTRSTLKEGSQQEWDAAMSQRMQEVHGATGWVSGRVLAPVDDPSARIIVGTWQRQEDWERWHEDADFQETRQRLEGLQAQPDEMSWSEVLVDEQA